MRLRKSHLAILIAGFLLLAIISSVYLASRILIPSLLEKHGRELLGVPVRVQSGGINLFRTTLWLEGLEVGNVPGSRERFLLSLKRFEFNLSFTSFLANELIIENIRFVDPILNLERDTKGILNLDQVTNRFRKTFRPGFRVGEITFFHHYAIRHFSVRNGIFRHFNQSALEGQKEWVFREIDFSFSEFDYPPKPENPVITSFHLSTEFAGQEKGKILILGSGNFLADEKSFKIKSDLQNIALRDLNSLLPSPAHAGMEGFSDIHSVFNCERNFLKIENKIRLRKINLPEDSAHKVDEVIFGFSRKTLSQFFSLTQDKVFQFDFSASGSLTDPSFDLRRELAQSFFKAAHEELSRSIDKLNSESMKQIEKLIAGQKSGEGSPAERLRQLVERFSEKRPPANAPAQAESTDSKPPSNPSDSRAA